MGKRVRRYQREPPKATSSSFSWGVRGNPASLCGADGSMSCRDRKFSWIDDGAR